MRIRRDDAIGVRKAHRLDDLAYPGAPLRRPGSEPGEPNYSPLWDETLLTWKAGATPVVIKSDTQVNALEKKGVLKERDGGAVLNCPIIKIG